MIAALLQTLAAVLLIPSALLGVLNARRAGWIRAGIFLGATVYRNEQPARFWRWVAIRLVVAAVMSLVLFDAVRTLFGG
ncbi:MAG: hypothetical protein V4466_05055 [Pseudomonadota bacterium]